MKFLRNLFWYKVLENYSWNQTWSKLKELINYKDLIKLLMSLINLIKDFNKEKMSLKVNLLKIKRIS
jgi:hypothetical protein